MSLRALPVFLCICFAFAAQAFTADTPLADPLLEQRARALFAQLRCPVCESQSIVESNAELAHDMRRLVRERIGAGDADEAIRDYLVERYGPAILMTPPLVASTYGLWLGPLLMALLGAFAVARLIAGALNKSGASDRN